MSKAKRIRQQNRRAAFVMEMSGEAEYNAKLVRGALPYRLKPRGIFRLLRIGAKV